MKRIHKAIKYLSLALLVSNIAMTIKAEEVVIPVETTQASQEATPGTAQTITPAAVVGLVAQAAEVKPVETESPVEEVIKMFKPFFTDKNYKVNKSFKKMCTEAVAILRKSTDKGLLQVADFLEKLCNKNILGIMLDLNNNKVILSPLVPDTKSTAPLAQKVLIERLKEAVAFKDK